MNRTVIDKVRYLLSESGLSEIFWAEAAYVSVYLINRTPSSTIGFKTPEEVWLNKKPRYKHLKKFGYLAYVYVDQGKLKIRAIKGLFIGYPPSTKCYKIWLLGEEKCVVNRHVKFHEENVYKDLPRSRCVV